MKPIRTFILLVFAGGLGGFFGSILGNAAGVEGNTDLFIGGVLGGLILAPAAAVVAGRSGWIARDEVRPTAIGAALGFIAAVLVAVNTLSSPVGPALSTLLTGIGGLFGRK